MDKQYLNHRKALNNLDYLEDDWVKTDNIQLVDISDFDELETASSSILPDEASYLVGKNISQQLEKEGNNFQDQEQDITNLNNPESELSEFLEESSKKSLETTSNSTEILRQSG